MVVIECGLILGVEVTKSGVGEWYALWLDAWYRVGIKSNNRYRVGQKECR